MQIQFENQLQCRIADLFWTAPDDESVELILKSFGKEAEIVYNMIIAEVCDTEVKTDLAEKVINRIK